MRVLELLRVVWINILQNRFKVLSTSLGIIVGAVTIVLVIAIGQGGEEKAAEGYSDLSADTIYINVNYQNANLDISKIEKLNEEIIGHILEENTGLSGMYLRTSTYLEVGIGKKKEYLSINGVTDGYSDISGLSFEAGSDFSSEDTESGARSVVVGGGVAKKFFGDSQSALGKRIKIDGKFYTVNGVLTKSGDGLQGLNADDSILMPYKTMKKYELSNDFNIPQAVGKARNLDAVKSAMRRIESTLDYYLQNGKSYVVEDAGSRINAATESARTMKMLLISVAAIVFVVGGIGIMNVLFVTVKERTKEIGVLKALGSTKSDILLQFLMESVFIGIFSGLVGVFISIFALSLMGRTDIPVSPSVLGMVVAFAFSVFTSAIFGFYPALKASQLKPVDALNYE